MNGLKQQEKDFYVFLAFGAMGWLLVLVEALK